LKQTESGRSLGRLERVLILLVLLLVAAGLRTVGLDWDDGAHLHPDERFLTMVAGAVESPDSLALYLDTANSPLNPYNRGYGNFFYGTLPLFLVRYAGEWADTACVEEPSSLARVAVRLLLDAGEDCSPGTYTGYGGVHLVGRLLSTLADLAALVFLFLIGQRLYSPGVGLLAVALGALAVLPIQHSHFFTVDNFANSFVIITLYFAVRAAQTGGWVSFALAGLASGLAVTCKMNTWPAALVVALAGVWWSVGRSSSSQSPAVRHSSSATGATGYWPLVLRLSLAALLFLLAFRLAQPYAFQGPGFFGLRLNSQWISDMSFIRRLMSGEVDSPPGHQWTARTAIVFPWVNMVVWGLGIPLGLAAWAGWALTGVELLRGWFGCAHHKHWQHHLIPWAWGTGFFLYQATQWVKSMRYLLPVYYVFILFGAYALWRLVRWGNDRSNDFSRSSRSGRLSFVIRHLSLRSLLLVPLIVLSATLLWALAFTRIYTNTTTRIAASRWIYAHVPTGETIVANEHWDDALPLRIDGHNPFGGMYQGLSTSPDGQMQNYNEDTEEKRAQLFAWLDETDYIFLSSNRLYGSIARLPGRYPLTTAYYRALFAGELGFELVADFTSYPALGSFQFPDQECPYPLMEADYVHQGEPIKVVLPPAEEAFSVYDHPRVLVFRKTAAYSRERVREVLGGIDVARALHGLKPVQVTAAPDLLEFDPQTWAEQQAGGTWSEMFHRDSLLNRYPGLAVVAWWAVVTGLGWLAFPLLFVALPRLRDQGYGLARVLGLLLVAYLTWLVASLRILPNTRGTILRMVLLLALVGAGVGWFKRDELRRFLRRRYRLLLLTEGLFALLYVVWVGVRFLQPDLWHPVVGGEKPMVFAYLNAVMKSTWFPPYNPWFSGTTINYYYFGFVIVGTLIKLIGTVPAIAYNLAVPLLFALTGVGAFSVAYNLFGGHERDRLLAGVMALVFTVVLGNLGVVHLIRNALISLGGETFPSTILGFPRMVAMFQGLWQVIAHGAKLPLRVESWYWHPTRIIPAGPGEVGPIAEFPAFTFLYADLHAHMIAFPLVLLALALMVYWARTPRPRWLSLALGGLVIGALYPANTWNFPPCLILGLAALAFSILHSPSPPVGGRKGGLSPFSARLKAFAWRAALLISLPVLLYLPYIRHYAAGGYASIEMWHGSRTPVGIYLWIHGILLFPLVTRLLIEVGRLWITDCRLRITDRGSWVWGSRFALIVGLTGLLGLVLLLASLGYEVALVVVPVAVLAAYLLFVPGMPASRRFLWLMVGEAMAIGLGVEVVALKGDIGRMNTVFKFYLQAWMLLSIAAGVSLAWVHARAHRWRPEWQKLWWVGMAALIFGGALFLPYGVRARAVDRMSPQAGLTLDGMAFMEQASVFDGAPERGGREVSLSGDYAAIRWMQDAIQGSPVVLEGLGYREYLWGNRVSVYTGLPAVMGWRWHQVQQRLGVLPDAMVDWRRDDVRECYDTSDVARAQEILARYGVRYVYVGDYERAYYDPAGLAKFDTMAGQGLLRVVYDAQGVRIYEVGM